MAEPPSATPYTYQPQSHLIQSPTGGPALARAKAATPAIGTLTATVATRPSSEHESRVAPLAFATRSASAHGNPGTRPTATSAAASAAASAAPRADCFTASPRYRGTETAASATMPPMIAIESTEPEPSSEAESEA